MSTRSRTLTLAFALPDGGGRELQQLLSPVPGLLLSDTISSVLLPALYTGQTQGIDAEYNAFTAARSAGEFFARHPEALARWQQTQRQLAGSLVEQLCQDSGRDHLVDCFPGSLFAARRLAEVLPQVPALIIIPDPLQILERAHAASDGSAARLRQAAERYRRLVHGPGRIADAIAAFASRALLIHQSELSEHPQDCLRRILDFIRAPAQAQGVLGPRQLAAPIDRDADYQALAAGYLRHLAGVLPALGYDLAALQPWLAGIQAAPDAPAPRPQPVRRAAPPPELPPKVEAVADPRVETDQALYRSAMDQLAAGDLEGGASRLIALAQADTPLWEVYDALASLALQQCDAAAASDLLQVAIAKAPRPGGAHLRLARLVAGAGQPEEALALLSPLLRAEPEHADALALTRELLGLSPIAWARLLTDLRTSHTPRP